MRKQERKEEIIRLAKKIYDLGESIGTDATLGMKLNHSDIREVKECFQKLSMLAEM